jgi:hypothetical protein
MEKLLNKLSPKIETMPKRKARKILLPLTEENLADIKKKYDTE